MGTIEGVVQAMGAMIASRHRAADCLQRVTDLGRAGCFPHDVTCEELGRALFRIAMNAPEEDPLLSILAGWRMAERAYEERVRNAGRAT